MAVKLWGPMLTGLAQGFQDYQTQQEDLSYTRQLRMNQLATQQLQNQDQSLKNQAAQQQLQNASLTHNYWVSALQDNGTGAGDAAASQAAPQGAGQVTNAAGAAPQQGGNAPAQSNFKPVGPLSMDQLAALDTKNGLPIGTTYGVMNAESAGNPNAVSPKGAQGLFGTMPATAAQPGYGLKPFSPSDPDGAVGYLGAMFKKAGGDPAKALTYYNAGPAGNPNNPETQAYVPKVLKGAQQFAAAYQLDQGKQQPTPADQIQAREDAGAATPVTAYQQATQAQGQQIQTMLRAAQNADKDGHPELAQSFRAQAKTLQDQQIELQKKSLDVQKEANTETEKLAGGVKDQASYNNFRQQIGQNPAMQATVAGLNLTGNYDLDRNKIQTVADRATSLKDQQDLQLKQQTLALKQAQEQRKQQQEDAQNVRISTAEMADQKRQADLQQKGVPFSPSIAATATKGTTPAQIQQAQKQVQQARTKWLDTDRLGSQSAKGVQDFSTQILSLLDKPNPVTTGGFTRVPGVGAIANAFDDDRQKFDKLGNQMVSAAAAANGASGGGRSAFTAAMYDRLKTQKPSLDLNPEVNKYIAIEYYNTAAMAQNMSAFTKDFLQANPDATPQQAQLMWSSYEQSLGPAGYVDLSVPGGYRMNTAGVPKLPDGRDNPSYKDWHKFFQQGGL